VTTTTATTPTPAPDHPDRPHPEPRPLASPSPHLHVVPALGSERIQAITPARLNRFYAEMLKSGRIGSERGLAPKTGRYLHGILRKAFADAVRWNVVQRNVADLADPPKVGAAGREMQAWTADELRTFLEHISEERLYPAYLLAATTGRRRGEIL